MVFKKTFSIIVPLLWVIFWAFPCLADWETVQIVDFGVMTVSQDTNVTMSYNGVLSNTQSVLSHRDEHNGTIRYTNTGNPTLSVKMDTTQPSNTPLTCVANCNADASCEVKVNDFRFNIGTQNVHSNSSADWNIGATIRISSTPCQGVFEGMVNLNATVKKEKQTVPVLVRIVLGDVPTINVLPQDDLDFGDILSTTASTVSVGTSGIRTCSPTSVCVANQSSNGTFRVENSSATAQTFTVDCPSGAVQMGNGNNFYVDSFICSASSSSVSSSAPATVNVGATLHVPQGQASGEYNATYTITVNN